MWIKNATIIGYNPKAKVDWDLLNDNDFQPTSEQALGSAGWSPIHDTLIYALGPQNLLHYTVEKKHIPASAVRLLVDQRAAEIEQAQGFAPGKVARKELKERIIDELLPRALTTRSTTQVWIDQVAHRIIIDSTSRTRIEDIQIALSKLGDWGMADVAWPGTKTLTAWLEEAPADFTNDDQVSLQYPGQKGKTVKYGAADLYAADVQQNLALGASVTAMAMTYDDRISFVMTDNMQIKRIKPLEIIKETAKEAKDVDRFDSDFLLMTAELSQLINTLGEEA